MNRRERRAARKQGAGPVAAPAPAAPDGAVAHLFSTAVGHFYAGRLVAAEQACHDALAFEPDHFDSLHLLGVIAFKAGRNDVAADVLAAALIRNDASAECHNNRGLALAGLARFDEAAVHFARAVALAPSFVPARLSLGNALKATGRLDEAAAEYRHVLALNPDFAAAHYNLGNVLKEQGELDDAKAHYQRALGLEPHSPEILSGLAATLDRQGQADEAQATYQRALALRPNEAEIHNNLGGLLWRQDRLDEAALHYRRALALKPGSTEAQNNLGIVLKKQAKLVEALDCFERTLAIDADHAGAQLNLCATLYELSLSDPNAARAQADSIMRAHAGKPLLQRGLAGILGGEVDHRYDSEYSKALFDHFAGVFDRTLVELRYLDMVHALLAALEQPAGQEPRFDVLDAGCGTGLCGSFIKPVARSLVGVDLSSRMLDQARSLSIYDRLVCDDAIGFMAQHAGGFDLIVSSDVLTYIGDVSDFARAAYRALRAGGRIAVSAESLDQDRRERDYELSASGRYRHARGYLERTFADAGLGIDKMVEGVMRMEAGQPAAAWIVVAHKHFGN